VNFAYQGFKHDHDRRCFTFRGVEEFHPISVFCIEVDLALLFRNRVPVQDGPMFCLQLLTTAALAGPSFLERLHNYQILEADLRPLLVERERRAAEKALKKTSRRPFRKPSSTSNVHLGTTFKER
jgi:hypothetical protein